MTSKTRQKLKRLFSNGRRPSETDFADLVDSSINPNDDGFNITPDEGIQIAPTQRNKLASIFSSRDDMVHPDWMLSLDDADKRHLVLQNHVYAKDTDGERTDRREVNTLLSLSRDSEKVGINTATPEHTLDVNGTIAGKARLGIYKSGLVPADGKYHNILTGLHGNHIFEVVAGVAGAAEQGRYAMLSAVAMNCHNPNFFFSWRSKPIRQQHAWYYSRWDRMKLRWLSEKNSDTYALQIKTIRDYGYQERRYRLKFHITQLWTETEMRYEIKDDEGISDG